MGSNGEEQTLAGVVALLSTHALSTHAHSAITSKLRQLGAKAAARFGRDVTHVIFQRKLQPSVLEKAAEEAELRSVYDRMAKVCVHARYGHPQAFCFIPP